MPKARPADATPRHLSLATSLQLEISLVLRISSFVLATKVPRRFGCPLRHRIGHYGKNTDGGQAEGRDSECYQKHYGTSPGNVRRSRVSRV